MSTVERPLPTQMPTQTISPALSRRRAETARNRTDRAAKLPGRPSLLHLAFGLLWLLLVVCFVATARAASVFEAVALALTGLASAVIWLAGMRYFAMWAGARLWARRRRERERHAALRRSWAVIHEPRFEPVPRVALLYCTADDANLDALRASAAQRYPVTIVILDDSQSPDIRAMIDDHARATGTRVIRRADRSGYKAGNLNYGIRQLLADFDYFVVLDSDSVLPPDFVTRALRAFDDTPHAGIVQARHRAVSTGTAFSTLFAGLLGTHIAVTAPARSEAGLSMFMGRGAMISAECYRAAGPVPEVVAEDLAFSLEARRAGYTVHYDHELVCVEDYPIDYLAFRTQHEKMVEGAVEFLRRNLLRTLRSPIRITEKIDVLIDQLMVPAMAVAGLLLMLVSVALGAVGSLGVQPLWALAATVLCGAAPLLPEAVRLTRRRGIHVGATFLAGAGALYASTLFVTLRATTKIVLGRAAVFRVTPKVRGRSAWHGIRMLRLELAIALVALVVILPITGAVGAAMPLIAPACAAVCLLVLRVRSVRGRSMARESPRRILNRRY